MAIFELSASSLNSFNQTTFDESIPNFSESAKPQMLDDLRQSRQLTHVHPAANAIKCDLNPISQIRQHLWNSSDLWVASNERSHPYWTANACIFLDQCIVAIECGLGRFTAIHCGKKVHEHSHAKIVQFICICTCTRYGCSMCFIDLWLGLSLDEHVWHLHTIAHLQIDYTQSLDCECTNVYRSAHSCHWFRNKKVRSHWLWNKKVRSHA